ncbi:MAG: ornithine carbamoyltransferase [Planctomycetia bacterium]|nr:ornithine carbamoyltransferase [Planctomycetia bacterium]
MKNLVSLKDLSSAEIEEILSLGRDLKDKYMKGVREPIFRGATLGMIFQKQSLRTRVSFETAMIHLGGSALFMSDEIGFGKREPVNDFAHVLSQMVDLVMIRAKKHEDVLEFVKHASVPVINGLTDYCHPCQALADIFTLREVEGDLRGKKMAWVGDANNVALSVALICGKLGLRFSLAVPEAYDFSSEVYEMLSENVPDLEVEKTQDPVKAVKGATAVFTDVWVSMGQEAEEEARKAAFAPYQVNAELMAHCPDAYFMHCLPAKRGLEVTDEVMESPRSLVIQEAGNRMHAQKGVLVWLLQQVWKK